MKYCPYCAVKVPANARTCPKCKKVVDLSEIEDLYNDDTVELKQSAARSIWFKENSRFIFPIIFLVIGLFAGAALSYSYSLLSFAGKEADYQRQIHDLQQTANNSATQAGQAAATLQGQLDQKDKVIAILKNQRRFMSQAINFTRRLAENSVITTADPTQADYYKRNVRYVINQYYQEKEKMIQLEVEDTESFNLETIPQLLSD